MCVCRQTSPAFPQGACDSWKNVFRALWALTGVVQERGHALIPVPRACHVLLLGRGWLTLLQAHAWRRRTQNSGSHLALMMEGYGFCYGALWNLQLIWKTQHFVQLNCELEEVNPAEFSLKWSTCSKWKRKIAANHFSSKLVVWNTGSGHLAVLQTRLISSILTWGFWTLNLWALRFLFQLFVCLFFKHGNKCWPSSPN